MTPRQWIRYVRRIEKNGFAICDGTTANFESNIFAVLYLFFIISGISFFMWVLLNWNRLKEKIRG